MGNKVLDVYQGSDWLTERWSVAQIFDTLDQIRELCSLSPRDFSPAPGTAASAKRTADVLVSGDEPQSQIEMRALLWNLCDELSSEIHTAHADLYPVLQAAPPLNWKSFEMRLHLDMLRHCLKPQEENTQLSKTATDTILALTLRMRDLLKQIDQ